MRTVSGFMIHLTRLNQLPLVVNADLIEHIEMNPDTVLFLTTGQKILVRENANEIIEKVVQFRRSVLQGLPCSTALASVTTRAASPSGIEEHGH
jgi:flagellar protein FlbD